VPNDKLREAIGFHFAHLLKKERVKQKVSLQALARKAGLARQTITFIETEAQSPTLDTMLRIASALKVDLAKTIGRAQRRASRKSRPGSG
jgi:transcriptional regulator with XRE-family HTH domain